MTSSLVGSEMCIRDSIKSITYNKDHRVIHDYYFGRLRHRPLVAESEKRPVSYTHLTLPTICSV
eukprot:5271679-Prorocentrum_lima.AAC.1